jgi:hypothetical protein
MSTIRVDALDGGRERFPEAADRSLLGHPSYLAMDKRDPAILAVARHDHELDVSGRPKFPTQRHEVNVPSPSARFRHRADDQVDFATLELTEKGLGRIAGDIGTCAGLALNGVKEQLLPSKVKWRTGNNPDPEEPATAYLVQGAFDIARDLAATCQGYEKKQESGLHFAYRTLAEETRSKFEALASAATFDGQGLQAFATVDSKGP